MYYRPYSMVTIRGGSNYKTKKCVYERATHDSCHMTGYPKNFNYRLGRICTKRKCVS